MNQLSGTTLAYLGDAIYEVIVRERLLKKGLQNVDHLHKEAILYTSAVGQKQALELIYGELTEEEISVYKRGRNASSDRKAKNASLADYQQATGFEALIGYLYLEQQTERLEQLCSIIFQEKSL